MGVCCSNEKRMTLGAPVSKVTENTGKRGTGRPAQSMDTVRSQAKKKAVKPPEAESMELRAAVLIQKWFRHWIGQLTARRQIAWRIFQKVEYYGERNQMKLNRFFRILIEEFQKEDSHSRLALVEETKIKPRPSKYEELVELKEIPPDVELDISPPFTLKNLNALMNYFKMGKALHYACVINLLIMTQDKLKTKSNLNEVTTSVTKKVTVIGDLHGNLDDLLTIFYKNDIPSVSNPYVFNGDLVDRGSSSIEVVMILCYCFLLFPNHVHINRGNHEDHTLNKKYGFIGEIKTKYQQQHMQVFKAFKEFFRYLPLGTIIDRKIFVVHGGIADTTDLEILGEIDRSCLSSVIRPPRRFSQKPSDDWEQAIDILWSDPTNEKGCEDNTVRGGGKYFGPDVTEDFLKRNNFELLIRSHECKPEGYEYSHSNKVLTIFSSSNYYHPGSNKGAYIVHTGDVKNLRLVQYVSTNESLKNINFKDNVISMEEKAVVELKKTICMQRSELIEKFEQIDVKKTGKVSLEEFGRVLSEVLGMNLPWILIQPKISKKDIDNRVFYESSFDSATEAKKILEETASDILFCNLEVLEIIFRAIDKDNSGFITMEEFSDAMKILTSHSDLNSDDIEDLGQIIDSDNNGLIDIDEFFEAFKISRT